ncbi:MAG: glycosyltransferase family 1 protein, partial [Candidatus Electrothrix sp. AUS4]|nr:glycosyltransferase family 1 protein [Candidatus Electrothrix sp. AUS4]
DIDLRHLEQQIRDKACILYPGIDFRQIDTLLASESAGGQGEKRKDEGPVFVWNHRWEHDKAPETFFYTLFELAEEYPFQVIVLGQHFRDKPEIFTQARRVLGDRLLHCGYAERREDYVRLLTQGDYIVSTACHEFFGISVLEGVRAGCCPVVPDRLSYRELFPEKYRYPEGKLKEYLKKNFSAPGFFSKKEAKALTEPYSWSRLGRKYHDWFRGSGMVSL